MNMRGRRGEFQRRFIYFIRTIKRATGIAAVLLAAFAALAQAADFAAKTLGDHGNVTVMEVSGNYDAINPDGSLNAVPRQEIAKEFFRTHKDEYDFLVIFSNFLYQMPDSKTEAFYWHVKNNVQGIGQEIYDNSGLFGSSGTLQGAVDMGNVSDLATIPFEPGFDKSLSILSHELLHRWAANVRFKESTGALSTALLGKDLKHWSYLLDSRGSLLYGNHWQDNGNGTFTSIAATRYYSPLDLYLMGLADASQVTPMLLIENPEIDPSTAPQVGTTVSGTARYVAIEDIIAAEGERVPGVAESQKSFKTAFIFITALGTFTGEELYGLENIRSGWMTRFSILSDGKAIVEVSLTPKEEVPVNPGPVSPPTDPRPLPPSIEEGVKWLLDNQHADGRWMDLAETSPRDTAQSVLALKIFSSASGSTATGLQWLKAASAGSADYLSRRIEVLSDAGQNIGALIEDLLSVQNGDGGWGSLRGAVSNPTDTALVLRAFAKAGYAGGSPTSKAVEYLKFRQNLDGGWGGDDRVSKVRATADVLQAFNRYKGVYPLEGEIGRGMSFLLQRQNPDGGFGNSPSTVYDTAAAVIALAELDASGDAKNRAVDYILNEQSADGSWRASAYQTALAISAVWKTSVDPDLSVRSEDITFDLDTVTTIPTVVNVRAVISNMGRTDVSAATVALYDGIVSEATKVGQQVVAFPGQSVVAVSFQVTVKDGSSHMFYVTVDPDNLVKEANKTNNTALKILSPSPTYDFELLPTDVSVSANPVDISRNVTISAKIANRGTMNAYNVQVKYYIDDPQGAFDIGTATVDIPAGGSVTSEMVWKTNKAGENMPGAVFVDAFNSFVELNEGNNKASVNLTVSGATDPNLTVSYKDIAISPDPVNQGGSVKISALVKNEGFSPASDIVVDFYKGVPGEDGVLLSTQTIVSLDPGWSAAIYFDWANIDDLGEKIIFISVDPGNLIKEIAEDDNDAFVTLKILSLPDLAISTNSISFSPAAPKDGDTVSITANIKNLGDQSASNALVRAYDNGILIGEQTVAAVGGNSQASVSFTDDTAGKSGAHQITMKVDPENAIIERSKDNNTASKTFGVQDANFWLTEPYISPNGDGVKDSTQFFFRLGGQQTVEVEILNEYGDVVKTFSGTSLADVTAGNVVWDGLDDEGMVVADGQYQLRVMDANDSEIGSLLVTVDNNRSPLSEAIGTKYLLNRNLSCSIDGAIESYRWIPDESGIMYYADNWSQQYHRFLGTVFPAGGDPFFLLSWERDFSNLDYDIHGMEVSHNGERIAFVLEKKYLDNVISSELWVINSDGTNRQLLHNSPKKGLSTMAWSPDSRFIIIGFEDPLSSYSADEVWLVRTDGTQETLIEPSRGYYYPYLKWSPDSTKIAYDTGSWIRVADTSGDKANVGSGTYGFIYTNGIDWLNNEKVVYQENPQYGTGGLWLADGKRAESSIKLSERSSSFSVSPNKEYVVFDSYDSTHPAILIADSTGRRSVFYESSKGKTSGYNWEYPDIQNFTWSADSARVAFFDLNYYPNLSIMDVKKANSSTVVLKNGVWLLRWLPDGKFILSDCGDDDFDGDSTICAINVDNGSTSIIVTDAVMLDYDQWTDWWFSDFEVDAEKILSPMGDFITYYVWEPESPCKFEWNLWTSFSLLNLTANISTVKEGSAVILKGIAADLNFEGYQIEYADIKTPGVWNLIAQPSELMVIDDAFTTWIPPYEGTFYVRLTVWDKAGNVAVDRKRVSWGISTSITNLYKSTEIFSPNGDGVKDTVSLTYTVLEPVHLEFDIYDEHDNVVRTYLKDHALPGADFIAWDGRDFGGNLVRDGKYKIKVSDYEFFVEVDNIPPDSGLVLTQMMQDYDFTDKTGSRNIYVDLMGHAVDANLKAWVLEYSQSDNPQQWFVIIRGNDLLAATDEHGSLLLNPLRDATIGRFEMAGLEFLVGKTLRISAEDLGGNVSTDTLEFTEEKIFLHGHNWLDDTGKLQREIFILAENDRPYPSLLIRSTHYLTGLETIRTPLSDIQLQVWNKFQWINVGEVSAPPSGLIDLKWNNEQFSQEYGAVRVRAVDALGKEHLSNEVMVRPLFYIDLCNFPFVGMNYLFEELKMLKLQIKSESDVRYPRWTDYKVFDSAKKETIPTGIFQINPLPELIQDVTYNFRMIGIGVSGKEYMGEERKSCQELSESTMVLSVKDYKEVDCGLTGDGKTELSVTVFLGDDVTATKNILLKTLAYYIQKPEGIGLLRTFDLKNEGLGEVTIDSSSMSDGEYPVKAVLTYVDLDNSATRELSAENVLVVDRTPPAGEISYPANHSLVCPSKIGDVMESRFGIPIEGSATDNYKVKRYELYYGTGDNPEEWLPTKTRINGKESVIVEQSAAQGQLGVWDVTDLKWQDVSLKLKVVDIAGNVSCDATTFTVDTVTEISGLTVDKKLFSPNDDGTMDDVIVEYQIGEYAGVDIKVFKAIKNADGSYDLDQTPVRAISSGIPHLGGVGEATWDGKGDVGTTMPDGFYGIVVYAKDSCGNKNSKWVVVEVDNTPPTVAITYPQPADPLGNIVEIKGIADDLHFQSYTLEVGEGDVPASWSLISYGTSPVRNNILGNWNTSGLQDRWTLRLSGIDTAGNSNIATIAVDLAQRKDLIKAFSASPRLFSPNADGRTDNASVTFELTDACLATLAILDSSGSVRRTFVSESPSGVSTVIWDGKDFGGTAVADGTYSVRLSASLFSNPDVIQEETITAVVDSTLPTADILQPLPNSYFKSDVVVQGTISDTNIAGYSISYSGISGAAVLDQANQNRQDYSFGILNGLPEGSYTLNVNAKDLAQNENDRNITFTIDRTPPKVVIDTPKAGEYYGSSRHIINIAGLIVETNLDVFSVRYGAAAEPAQWVELMGGNAVPSSPQIFSWKVGKDNGVADGTYSLSLYAKDKAGSAGEARVVVIVDNTPPVVSITAPQEGQYVKAATDIIGTALDQNLEKYLVELSAGDCAGANKWAAIGSRTTSVQNGVLTSWPALPPDGAYCLRISAVDKVGLKAEAKVSVEVDTHPPAGPALAGSVENNSGARLTWSGNTEPDLHGYDLYRDGQKINAALVHDTSYLDQDLQEGNYVYSVRGVDLAGNESGPSNEVRLRIDLTGPDAKLRSPQADDTVSGMLDIKGTAYSADDFKEYRVFIGEGPSPSAWTLLRRSPLPTSYGVLTQWDTLGLARGDAYSIKLEAEDLSGNVSTHQIEVVVDNTPPSAPVLVSAAPNGSDVALTWQANSEPDLAGYLLYRNDQLTNDAGIAVGNLKPCLISTTEYADKSLPDGKYNYYLIAMDQAGNMSDQSNSIEVTLDTHPPHATITTPADGSKFDSKALVTAESPDKDIAGIQFQYKKAADAVWTSLGGPGTREPYVTYIDPEALGLEYGDYQLRAVATDTGGNTDSAPLPVTVSYTDITSPSPVRDLKAATHGKDVTLGWTAVTDAGLEGYWVYRISGGSKMKLNTAAIAETVYHDDGLADGAYSYEVAAVDKSGNESDPSDQADARVYVPVIVQPYTPSDKGGLQLTGGNATAGSSVELSVDPGSGPVPQGTVEAGQDGNFTFNATLTTGDNKFTAIATDTEGNVSRTSDLVVVVYSIRPAAPTAMSATAQGYDVSLTWDHNSEADVVGYYLFRNGEKLNVPITAATTSGNASSTYASYAAANALDGDPSTYWMSNPGNGNPVSFEVSLASRELINHIDIQWQSAVNAGNNYEIHAWSGYAWIPIRKVSGNAAVTNGFDIKPSYRTDKLRVYIVDGETDPNKKAAISEIAVMKDDLILQSPYSNAGLADGSYSYRVTAVNYYGFESPLSDEAKAEVGDVMPPAAPLNLNAAASGPDINLGWDANSETDLAGYNLYRLTPEGWNKVNGSLLTGTTYADIGLANGAYTYRVTAIDMAGNESLPSNEASVVVAVQDTVAPEKPALFFPTVAGLPVKLTEDKTDVAGFAEPGTAVELFSQGVKPGRTTAQTEDVLQSHGAAEIRDGAMSPDGKMFAYEADMDGSLWLWDLATGETKQIAPYGYRPLWSPDGKRVAYEYDEYKGAGWYYYIGIYDTHTGTASRPADDSADVYVEEYEPSWSAAGSRISFISNRGGAYDAWIKDFTSGAVTQVTSGIDLCISKISPDSRYLAYMDCNNYFLSVTGIDSGDGILVDENADDNSLEWSPQSGKILFKSYTNGNSDIYYYDVYAGNKVQVSDSADQDSYISWSPDGKRIVYAREDAQHSNIMVADIQSLVKTQVTTSEINKYAYYPVWSPDGNRIAYSLWDNDAVSDSVWIKPLEGSGGERMLQQGLYIDFLGWAQNGAVVYMDTMGQAKLYVAYPAGYFGFAAIPLVLGENLFSAISTDSSGNVSQLSDEISVTFDTSSLPDLETATDDIYLYPAVPLAGETVAMNIAVWNRGREEAKEVEADVYVLDSSGYIELVKSEKVVSLAPGDGTIVGATWNTAGKNGAGQVIVVLDPSDKVLEKSEENNYATKGFYIVGGEGVTMSTALTPDRLSSGLTMEIGVTVANAGPERAADLEVLIEDGSGGFIASAGKAGVQVPYATQEYHFTWNVAATFAGDYRVHALLKDASVLIAESTAPFVIMPDISVKTSITTDKAKYGPNEGVSLAYTIENEGANYIIPAMKAVVRIIDQSNKELFREGKEVFNELPGSTVTLGSVWSAAPVGPGNYTASVDVYLDGNKISGDSTSFEIIGLSDISGSIKATPPSVLYGNQLTADYSVSNSGNTDAPGLTLRIIVVDPGTQTVMYSADEAVDLMMKGSLTKQTIISTGGFRLKTYSLVLKVIQVGSARTLAQTSFTVIDGLPPVVTGISPVSGGYFNDRFDLAAVVTDDFSGVDTVQYRVDEGSWLLLPPADLASGRYAAEWVPAETDEGNHTIYFMAADKAGNMSNPLSRSITIDLTPPELSLSTLSDGSWTNNEVLNVAGMVKDNFGIREVAVDDTSVPINPNGTFSYPVGMQDGENTIEVVARDLAGNETTETRTINLDCTAPVITIITPADNMKTKLSPVSLIGGVNEHAAVVVSINGADPVPAVMDGDGFSLQSPLVYGMNTIEVTATDWAGNLSSSKRTVLFDDRSPGLSITNPPQDIKTNLSDLLLQGEVEDLTSVIATIVMEDSTYTPVVENGRYEQPLVLTTEGTYQISVKAVDEAGNETIVQRNVIYDKTPPSVTIEPVTTPTRENSQILIGTAEAGAIVTVACPTATVGAVAYPTQETWQAELTNMREGDNLIEVTASDEVRNTSLPATVTIVVDKTPPAPPVIISPASDSFASSNVVDIKGRSEPGATIDMVFNTTLSAQADPVTGEFVFSQVQLTPAANAFAFTATDAAGNTSAQAPYVLYFDISAWFTGAIGANPDPVSRGKEVTLTYGVTNSSSADVGDLDIRVYVIDPDTEATAGTFEAVTDLPVNTTKTGTFKMPTADLSLKTYRAVLEVSSMRMAAPKTLASTTFEIKPELEASKTISDVANLLVWVNEKCHHVGVGREEDKRRAKGVDKSGTNCAGKGGEEEGEGEEEGCVRLDLLEKILRQTVRSYLIVHDKIEFRNEIRNPYYTDVLVIGDHEPLADHYKEELREKVFSDCGLIASLWSSHGDDYEGNDSVFGIKHEGAISGNTHIVTTIPGPITADGSFMAEGPAERIELKKRAIVAGWMEGRTDEEEEHQRDSREAYPAIVLNDYGKGKTVYYAFDLGATFDETNYGQLAALISNSLAHVHRKADTDIFRPGQFVPVQLKMKSLGGAFDLKIAETYPAGISIYDPLAGKWVKDNPWIVNVHLGPNETKTVLYYILLPDRRDTYTLQTEVGYMEAGTYTFDRNLTIGISVAKDASALSGDVVAALSTLDLSGTDRAKIRAAIRYISYAQKRTAMTRSGIEENIADALRAIDALLEVESSDVSEERLMTDGLLRGWESRWYYLELKE